jgi:hypothetical protein
MVTKVPAPPSHPHSKHFVGMPPGGIMVNKLDRIVEERKVSTACTAISETGTSLEPYYMQSLANALRKPYSMDYFEILFRDHFMQNF